MNFEDSKPKIKLSDIYYIFNGDELSNPKSNAEWVNGAANVELDSGRIATLQLHLVNQDGFYFLLPEITGVDWLSKQEFSLITCAFIKQIQTYMKSMTIDGIIWYNKYDNEYHNYVGSKLMSLFMKCFKTCTMPQLINGHMWECVAFSKAYQSVKKLMKDM